LLGDDLAGLEMPPKIMRRGWEQCDMYADQRQRQQHPQLLDPR
jgi:hypothetical protein